jgi:hypothetical protein
MARKNIHIFLITIFFYFNGTLVSAQCPSSVGLIGTPIVLNGNCFINIQLAIPNSIVSIYNTAGIITQGTANNNGDVVIPYPCSANPITSIISRIISPVVQTCSEFTINPILILPVKLISFTGIMIQNNTVLLSWRTSYEFQNDKFEIEKSREGINYEILATVASAGNSTSEKNYSFEDFSFSAGTSVFYRLKQTDIDGKKNYSKVVYISDTKSAAISLFPNPVRSGSSIMLKGIPVSDVKYSNISITDLLGNNVSYKITGGSTIEMSSSVVSGIYLFRIIDKVLKLIKE